VDDCCREHHCAVIGGNLGDAASVQLTATALGACRSGRRLSRRGAHPGDALLLVGSPGYLWSAALLKQGHAVLDAASEREVFDRAVRPIAQLRAGQLLAARDDVHAAIDISDGLYPSVQSLCSLGGVGAAIDADAAVLDPLPLEVCRQADVDPFAMAQLWGDWTLLVAVDGGAEKTVAAELRAAGIGSATIGRVLSGSGTFLDRAGQRTNWRGVDAERFTESSWRNGKLRDYLTGLTQPR
jgi:thiamine-monophosphate kinase